MNKSRVGPVFPIQILVTVAVTATMTAALAWYWTGHTDLRATFEEAAGSLDHRVIEARVTGFPYRRLATPRGSVSAQDRLAMLNAAASITRAFRGADNAQSLHATGVSLLLLQRWDLAVQTLHDALRLETRQETIAAAIATSKNATLLSDLSAAHHARARHRNRPHDFIIAAEAAERAWQLERTPETAWNRALTIEALSMRDAAIRAWNAYRALDHDSPWLAEVRQHLDELKTPSAASRWNSIRALLERAAVRADRKTLARVIESFPKQVRTTAEYHYLPRAARGEAAAMTFCRAIGQTLQTAKGESLLHDSVAHLDAADAPRRAALAHAFAKFVAAMKLRDHGYRIDEAGRLFLAAYEELKRAGSPFAGVARLFFWNCDRYANNRGVIAETGAWLAKPPERYPALVAQVRWSRGVSLLRAGEPQTAIDEFSHALDTFTRLGETDNVMAMHEMLSEAYDYIGDSDEAWRRRFAALECFGTSGSVNATLLETMRLCAMAALKEGFPNVAVLFLNRQIADTPESEDDTRFTALLWRSSAHRARGDVSRALSDLRQARSVAEQIDAPSVQASAFNQLEMVLDRLSRAPHEAARQQILDEAIAYATEHALTFRLSQFYLQQGLEHLQRKRLDAAERSFFASIDQLEQQRDTMSDEEQRSTFLAARQDVYRVLAALLCERRDYARAFDVIERSRARTLFEQVSQHSAPTRELLSLAQIQAGLQADTAVVAFGATGDRLGVWLVSATEVRFTALAVETRELEQRVMRFRGALRDDDQQAAIAASRALYDAVIRPWYAHARRFPRLIFVADTPLAAVPFSALNDRTTGEFLLHRHVISAAPSANVLVASAARQQTVASVPALIVAPSTSVTSAGDEILLGASRAEATQVAKHYGGAVVLDGAAATRDEFLARAPHARLIHFAGHAVAADAAVPHLLFASGRPLYAKDIRALRLQATRLVVLAACDSGTDLAARDTQGISSLARAFLAAGVPAVVASYWDVDDAPAARLSRRFHSFLARGDDPAAALRNAQLQSLTSSDPPSRNVSSWAPFVVIGQPTTQERK
jgi:CHAT domain-containing protein